MKTTDSPRTVRWSVALYRRGLALYPGHFRREFGEEMASLFGDQCRVAWRASGLMGLTGLWFRSLPDLGLSVCREYYDLIQERNRNMSLYGSALFRASLSGLAVFIGIVVASALWTGLMPQTYSSVARISISAPLNSPAAYDPYWLQTQFEVLRSNRILTPVVEELGLAKQWGNRDPAQGNLGLSEAVTRLRQGLNLRQTRSTSLVEIRYASIDRLEAAAIANKVAEVYRRETPQRADLVDPAEPGLRPVRPNVYLNTFLGLLTGLILGALMFGWVLWIKRQRPAVPV